MKDGKKAAIALGAVALGAAGIYFATRAEAAPPKVYICPYCGISLATYEELVAHVSGVHPGERIPIDIIWG